MSSLEELLQVILVLILAVPLLIVFLVFAWFWIFYDHEGTRD